MNDAFKNFIETLELKHFKAYELLVKGSQHTDLGSPAYNLNTDPPEELWENIVKTVQVLDEFRAEIGEPIIFTSVYRSPKYNTAIGGVKNSQHMKFNAIDFMVIGGNTTPAIWSTKLKELRAGGRFSGGIGVYSSFVHLDTRGTNHDW